jgi:hypothetical protein
MDSQERPFQFRIVDLLALMALVAVLGAAIKSSVHYLPPIGEMPPHLGDTREGRNWIGQGGSAFAGYSFLLLGVAYGVKRLILTCCTRRLPAVLLFLLFVILSLPYIWLLCEPDWFNPFIYRVSCWIGGPIAIWFVPTVSFVVDLCFWGTARPFNHYLIRSAVEVALAFPLWVVIWNLFSFWILGWGWI